MTVYDEYVKNKEPEQTDGAPKSEEKEEGADAKA